MASILFGLVVTDARGKLGGHVFTKGRSGNTLRTKGIPTNPQTAAQQAIRAALGALSSAWRSLTEAQRASWNSAVESFMKTNVFGNSYAPSGKNLYVSLNQNLSNAGQTAIESAPEPAAVSAAAISEFNINLGFMGMQLSWADTTTGQTVLVFVTPPMSAGKYFVKSQYRLLSTAVQSSGSPLELWTAYAARFGTPVAGQKVYAKVIPINNTTGQAGVVETISAIVA